MVKRLIQAYKLVKESDKLKELADDEKWTEDDQFVLAHSYAVHKLVRRLQAAGTKAAVEACSPSKDNSEHRRGMAYGVLLTVNLIQQHFPQSVGASTDNLDEPSTELPAGEFAI